MASGKLFYNVLNKDSFEKRVSQGDIPFSAIAFLPASREIWNRGVYYPCDFSSPTLAQRPDMQTLSYTDSLGYIRSFRPGQACVYVIQGENASAGVAIFKGVKTDGNAMWEDLGQVSELVQEAVAIAHEAEFLSQDAYAYATQALDVAATARGSVAVLEGLADTTEAQRTLAGLVTQIQDNTYRITRQENRIQVISESDYAAMGTIDPSCIYMIYEDAE